MAQTKPVIKKYEVLKHCLGQAPGAVVDLYPRQAVSLVAGGLLKEVKPKTTRSKSKEEK